MTNVVKVEITPIYLSEEETRLFIGFQKHHKLFEILDKEGILGCPNSSFEAHFDKDGKLGVINLHRSIR